MVPKRCNSCGALNFYEEESKYVCTYCNSSVLKEPEKVINHTYIIKENKYRYALIIAVIFLVYIIYTQLIKTNDTVKANTPQNIVRTNTQSIAEKWSMMTKGVTPKVYQSITVDKESQIFTFCYKDRHGNLEISRDRYGEMSKPIEKTCIPNTQTTLYQDDGYIKATSINVNGQSDIKLTKYNTDNNKIWETTLGSIHNDTLTHIVPGLNGYVVLAGTSSGKSKNYSWAFQVYDDVSRANITSLTTPIRFWQD